MLDKIADRKTHATKLFTIAALSTLLFLFIWHLGSAITYERRITQNMFFFLEASHTMEKASDYLTAEARAFSVTQDVNHLNNYWAEVNTERRRDAAVSVIISLSGDEKLLTLLQESKANSDALIETELTSMRLIMEAKHTSAKNMPVSVAEFTLPEKYASMSDSQKIKQAQIMLFDKKYYDSKASIMSPLGVFRAIVEEDLVAQVKSSNHAISILLLLSKALAVAVVVIAYHCARAVPVKVFSKPKSRPKKK